MNMTTEHPPQELLGSPQRVGGPSVGEDGRGSDVSEVVVAFVSTSIVFLVIFVVFIAVFIRCRKNRKVYVPVTPNIGRMQSTGENHIKETGSMQNQSHVSDIFESLVASGKETDEEAEVESNDCSASHSEGINLNPATNYDSTNPTKNVPSRNTESKHSRSLPSLKHLSAHEEALSYLAIGSPQNSCSNQQAKPQASSGVFSSFLNTESGFIRSRSFNERIAFGLNISRHSLTNRNRINVTAFNRCMTTSEPESKPKSKGKENIKSRKQRNIRSSFIKSMRISNLAEFIPTFNIRKRLGNSTGRQRMSLENYRSPFMANSNISPRSQSSSTDTNAVTLGEEIVDKSLHRTGRHSNFRLSPSLNSERLLENFSQKDFLEEQLSCDRRSDTLLRSKSCIIFLTPSTSKADQVALKTGNATSFDQLEEYSKKFTG